MTHGLGYRTVDGIWIHTLDPQFSNRTGRCMNNEVTFDPSPYHTYIESLADSLPLPIETTCRIFRRHNHLDETSLTMAPQ